MNSNMEVRELILIEITKPDFIKLVMSNPIDKHTEYKKIVIIPKISNNKYFYQFELYYDTKIKHENIVEADITADRITGFIEKYKQTDLFSVNSVYKIFRNRNGYKIISDSKPQQTVLPSNQFHNVVKNYIIKEDSPFLYGLGITNKDGKLLNDKQKKFRQINRYIEMVKDIEQHIPDNPKIIDVGCGNAYLSFALYHYLTGQGFNPTLVGIDLKEDVICNCNKLADELKFTNLSFRIWNAENLDSLDFEPNFAVSLHACDTATDYALAYAILKNCKVILSAPCCQHELYKQIKNDDMHLLLKHGIIKERFAALLTDSLRAAMLDAFGYKTQLMEFIDTEHTPKNIILRAIQRTGKYNKDAYIDEYFRIMNYFSVNPKLYELLKEHMVKTGRS